MHDHDSDDLTNELNKILKRWVDAVSTDIPLEAAKGCLAFTNTVIEQANKAVEENVVFDHNMLTCAIEFRDFLTIAINAEFELISVPERHRKIYSCLAQAALISTLPIQTQIALMKNMLR
jgi:hypothetical protein